MRHLPAILAVLALPAGLVGYTIGVAVMSALPLPGDAKGILTLFVPLFIAGLCMMPFLIPFLDRKAKQDLAAHRRDTDRASGDGGGDGARDKAGD
jgi:hypothetical protein